MLGAGYEGVVATLYLEVLLRAKGLVWLAFAWNSSRCTAHVTCKNVYTHNCTCIHIQTHVYIYIYMYK